MNKLTFIIALIIAVSCIFPTFGLAAKPKPKPKAPVKKPAAEQPHYVKGTTQLSGENAQLNTVYTLGKENPFNITLKTVEYSVDPILINDELHTVTTQEKFLVLHMIYHNPQNKEVYIRWDSFSFTAIDPKDQNHDGLLDIAAEGGKDRVDMYFKPAQKKDVYGIIKVPAVGEIPKLIIKSTDALVLRYNLKDKIKALPALYADPEDKKGATALSQITCATGVAYPINSFSFKLNKVDYSTAKKMGEYVLEEGEQFCVVNFTLKNITPKNNYFRWDTLTRKLIDTDGVETGDCVDMYQASKDKTYESDLTPNQEITLRYIFKIPADSTLKSFTNTIDEYRTLVFDISKK